MAKSHFKVLLAEEFKGTVKGQHRAAACHALKVFYDLSDGDEWVWSRREHKRFEEAIHAFLSHYAYLAKDAFDSGLTRYSIVQKFHLLAHYGGQCKYSTPRTCWTYGPESFMSIIKRIASSCDRGTAAWQIPLKVCSKFSLAYHLLLKGWLDVAEED